MLRSQGMRITRSRRGIMSALFKSARPLNLLEIQQEALVEGGVLPDYATVFRMMMLLERLGIVHKVNLRRSCTYFELTNPTKQQYHLVCTDTGQVTALELPAALAAELAAFQATLADQYGYESLHHSLDFFGKSPAVQFAANTSASSFLEGGASGPVRDEDLDLASEPPVPMS